MWDSPDSHRRVLAVLTFLRVRLAEVTGHLTALLDAITDATEG
jgi:hypothetical protein